MNPEIKIGADARKVDEARQKVDKLKESLNSVRGDSGEGFFGNEGLEASSELIRRVSDDITRMKSLVRSGEYKGGLLNTRQWEELGKISGNINENLNSWADNINEARTALWKLTQEKERLSKVSNTNPGEWMAAQERLGAIGEEEKGLRKHYEFLRTRQGRVGSLEDKVGDLSTRAGMLRHEQAKDTSGGGAGLGKILPYLAAATGGFSVLTFLAQSREMYRNYAISSAGLAARGIVAPGSMELYGFNETNDYARSISDQAGLYGGRATRGLSAALHWSRATDTDPSLAIGLKGQYRNLFGDDDKKSDRAMNALYYIGQKTEESPTRINRVLSAGFNMVASRQLSGELSSRQAAEVMGTTFNLIKALGTSGKDPSTLAAFQGAFKPTGNRYMDLLKYRAMGMLDGPMTMEKINRMNLLEARGATTPDGMEMLAGVVGTTGDIHMQRNMVFQMLGVVEPKKQDQIIEALRTGALSSRSTQEEIDKYLNTGRGAPNEAIEKGHAAWRSKSGVLARKITGESARIGAGGRLETAFGDFETKALQGMDRFVRSELMGTITETIRDTLKSGGSHAIPIEKQTDKVGKAFESEGFLGLWKEQLKSWLPTDQDKETMKNFTNALNRFIGLVERGEVRVSEP